MEVIFETSDFFSQLVEESMRVESGDLLFAQLVNDPQPLIHLIEVNRFLISTSQRYSFIIRIHFST
jgi:hypothetical protein